MRRFIIDTDTASDDAVAIILALREPTVKVEAITTVMGNVPLETATRNALISVEKAGTYEPPVYVGCGIPLIAEPRTAQHVHGDDGLGNMFYPDSKLKPQKEHAVDAMLHIIDENAENLELITLGPLTNIAMAMLLRPDTMKKIKKITIMGGAHMRCNAYTATSEFNIIVDAEAAKIVFDFGIPIVLAPLEICLDETALNKEEIDRVYSADTELAKFAIDCNRTLITYIEETYGEPKLVMPDPTAVASAVWPEIIWESTDCHAFVDIKGSITYGQTVLDYYNVSKKPHNVKVIDKLCPDRFKKIVFEKLTGGEIK